MFRKAHNLGFTLQTKDTRAILGLLSKQKCVQLDENVQVRTFQNENKPLIVT